MATATPKWRRRGLLYEDTAETAWRSCCLGLTGCGSGTSVDISTYSAYLSFRASRGLYFSKGIIHATTITMNTAASATTTTSSRATASNAETASADRATLNGGGERTLTRATVVWYCCRCNSGPMIFMLHRGCVNCHHLACGQCLKTRVSS